MIAMGSIRRLLPVRSAYVRRTRIDSSDVLGQRGNGGVLPCQRLRKRDIQYFREIADQCAARCRGEAVGDERGVNVDLVRAHVLSDRDLVDQPILYPSAGGRRRWHGSSPSVSRTLF